MKKQKNLYLCLLVICFSSWAFSAVKKTTFPHLADSISEVRAYKAILSYKGEPVCVANTITNPSLTPSFLSVGSGHIGENHFIEELDGPQCDTEDMNRIYKIAQNSILVDDPKKGVEVAALFIPYATVCAFSALTGGIISTSAHFLTHYKAKNPNFVSISSGGLGGQ